MKQGENWERKERSGSIKKGSQKVKRRERELERREAGEKGQLKRETSGR